MAIQTQMSFGAGGFASQDCCYMDNIFNTNTTFNNINNNLYNDLVLNLHQKPQEHQCFVQFQNLQNPSLACYNATTTATTASCTTASVDQKPPMSFSHGFDAHLDKHTQEIDQYIVSQHERLKVALQEETKKQMGEIWRKLQAKGMMIMQQKNQEIAKATKKRRELEETMIKMEEEKEAWKRMAVENESMVISLNNTLEQVKEQNDYGYLNNTSWNGVDDAESCCDDNDNIYNKNEKKREEIMRMGMKCKVCKKEEASMLLLPCRHLCCCIACHTCLDACPLCHSLKKASIQTLFS